MNYYLTIFSILSFLPLLGCETVKVQFEFKSAQSELPTPESLITSSTANSKSARKALIIGNANYPASRLFGEKPLSNPRHDAQDIATRLAQYDFNVTTILNANSTTMKSAIKNFTKQLTPNDVALVYYSGHGIATICHQDDGQKNYLVPVGDSINSREDLCQYSIAAESLIDKLTQRGTGTNILILNSCRKNLDDAELKGIDNQGFTGMYGGSGTFIGYATAPGKLALGNSESRNSLYTETLLNVLKPPYDNQPIETLFQQVRTVVVQKASKLNRKQVPWDANGLEESFCFRSPCHSNNVVANTESSEKLLPKPKIEVLSKLEATDLESADLEPTDYLLPKLMRVTGGCFRNQQQRRMCVDAFYIGTREVTNAEFRRFLPFHSSGQINGRSLDQDQQPVVNITWYESSAYATWLSEQTGKKFRLPTDAELEYAAQVKNLANLEDEVGFRLVEEIIE